MNHSLSPGAKKEERISFLTENMRHTLNKDILIGLVLRKLRKEFSGRNVPPVSKLMILSKVVTTDIISSFQVV